VAVQPNADLFARVGYGNAKLKASGSDVDAFSVSYVRKF